MGQRKTLRNSKSLIYTTNLLSVPITKETGETPSAEVRDIPVPVYDLLEVTLVISPVDSSSKTRKVVKALTDVSPSTGPPVVHSPSSDTQPPKSRPPVLTCTLVRAEGLADVLSVHGLNGPLDVRVPTGVPILPVRLRNNKTSTGTKARNRSCIRIYNPCFSIFPTKIARPSPSERPTLTTNVTEIDDIQETITKSSPFVRNETDTPLASKPVLMNTTPKSYPDRLTGSSRRDTRVDQVTGNGRRREIASFT